MFKVIKKNQLTLLVLALMLVTAGYLNYNSNQNITTSTEIASLGDATLVNSNAALGNEITKGDDTENKENTVLTNSESTIEEKNNAYEKISHINSVYNEEEKLEKEVKSCCNIDSFVEVNDNEINVVGLSSNHSKSLANDIMRAIQAKYDEQVIVTVNFK